VEYIKLFPAVQHRNLESPAPQDGLTNMPETSLPVDQFHLTLIALTFSVRPLILTLKTGFSSCQNLTICQITTILLKVKLLIQRTLIHRTLEQLQGTQRHITAAHTQCGFRGFANLVPADKVCIG
jgi:hypothetical protein